jgi:hypothetical protein
LLLGIRVEYLEIYDMTKISTVIQTSDYCSAGDTKMYAYPEYTVAKYKLAVIVVIKKRR